MMWGQNPWRELERMQRRLDELTGGGWWPTRSYSFPLINLYESENTITLTAELPGLKKEDIDISVADNVLTIKGNRAGCESREGFTQVRCERPSGDFEKSVEIPSAIEQDHVEANFKNGVLRVGMPKSAEARSKRISIQ